MKSPNEAQGRLPALDPIAIVDIGSNSVRLVAYEGLTRAPNPIFNDKLLAGSAGASPPPASSTRRAWCARSRRSRASACSAGT